MFILIREGGGGQRIPNFVARTRSLDKLFNPEAIIPPRPTISNLQWISGTQHTTATNMDTISEYFPTLSSPLCY